jgi:predicted AAA+ superfamily ATPase
MLAVAHGQLWNASAVGQSLGLSYHTVNGYLDYLEGAYLIRRLSPWSGNLRKRLTRSPKVYLRDTGLLHALLRIGSRAELLRHPAAGASWEGFVIEQLLGTLAASGIDAEAYFLRTSDGYEIDLLLALGGGTAAIEIKLSAHATPQDLARLERAADLVSAEHRYVVCQTNEPVANGTRGVFDLTSAIKRLKSLGRAGQ